MRKVWNRQVILVKLEFKVDALKQSLTRCQATTAVSKTQITALKTSNNGLADAHACIHTYTPFTYHNLVPHVLLKPLANMFNTLRFIWAISFVKPDGKPRRPVMSRRITVLRIVQFVTSGKDLNT